MVDFGQMGLLTVDYGAAHRVFWGWSVRVGNVPKWCCTVDQIVAEFRAGPRDV